MKSVVVLFFLCFLGVISCDNFTTPYGIAVAFAGVEAGRGASVSFSTYNVTGVPYAIISEEGQKSITLVEGYTKPYYTSSFQHHVVIDSLKPFTRYTYVVGMKNSPNQSKKYSFVTARAAGDYSPFSFTVFGDMGVRGSKPTYQMLQTLHPDFFIHVGDISYADDENVADRGSYESTWDDFQSHMETVSGRSPYMVCPGNHEATCISTGEVGCPDGLNNFSAYRHRFLMPSQESGGVENMWYSFDYGMAHFIFLSSETDYKNSPEGPKSLWGAGPFGDQMTWLKNDLDKATQNRDKTPWIIAIAHRPLYSTGTGDFPPNAKKTWRGQVEDLFYEANVDLYLSGHVHAYERLYPIYNGEVEMTSYDNPRDITPLVIGNAGSEEGLNGFGAMTDYIAFRNNEDIGYGTFTIHDENTLSLQMIKSVDGSELDSFTLTRSRS